MHMYSGFRKDYGIFVSKYIPSIHIFFKDHFVRCFSNNKLKNSAFKHGNKEKVKTIKMVSSQIRSTRPLEKEKKKFKKYDHELGINQSLLEKFLQAKQDNEYDNDDEDNYLKVVHEAESIYDIYKSEKEVHRKFVKRKIIERLCYDKPKEPCLVTWAAKEQMLYLYNLDPTEWTPRKLSESFPITEQGVKKLLKYQRIQKNVTDEKKQRHDENVANNWKLLEEGKLENVKPELLNLYNEGKLSVSLALPRVNLPRFEKNLTLKLNKPSGEFFALIEPYLKNQTVNEEQMKNIAPPSVESDKEIHFLPQNNKLKFFEEDEIPSVKFRVRGLNITNKQFKERFQTPENNFTMQPLQSQKIEKKLTCEEIDKNIPENVQKYKEPIELTIDSENAYLYNPNTSYQHPMGKNELIRENIKIPKHKYREGGIYKVNDCFYSDDGEFLYRVPTE